MVQGKWIAPGDPMDEALAVRQDVFVEEQGFSAELEQDALDAWSWHVVLYLDERPAATARIYYQDGAYWIGRICVKKAARGQGLGDLLMRLLLDKARRHYAPQVCLGAQLPVVDFYRRYGFEPYGQPYEEEGVPHVHMRLDGAQINLSGSCKGKDCKDCPEAGTCPPAAAKPEGFSTKS